MVTFAKVINSHIKRGREEGVMKILRSLTVEFVFFTWVEERFTKPSYYLITTPQLESRRKVIG